MGQSIFHGIHHSPSKILKFYKKCLTGSWSLDFGVKGYKMTRLDGHTFGRRWIFLYTEDDNNYSISMTIFSYDPNIKLLCCKNHRSSHWRCSVKEGVLKDFAYNFIKKRLQHWGFRVKLAKFLRTSIFKNMCERLLHLFPSQN